MVILLFGDKLNIGGTETHIFTVAQELRRRGHRVIIGTSGGPLEPAFVKAGLEVVRLPFKSDDPVLTELSDLIRMVKDLVNGEQVDILHANFLGGMKVASQVSQELGIPLIVTVHGLYYPFKLMRRAVELSTRVIAVSIPARNYVVNTIKYEARKVTVIPNGIDCHVYQPGPKMNRFRKELGLGLDEKAKVVLTCGRIAWGKTRVIASLIEAARLFTQDDFGNNIYYVIAGSGPDTSLIRLRVELTNQALGRRVITMVGERTNLVEAYQAADLVVGTARVALEAMSCARPVIAAGNAGYIGAVHKDRFGMAWENYFGDHKAPQLINTRQLISDMAFFLNNPNKAESIGRECRLWVEEQFAIEKVVSKIEKVYQEARSEQLWL